MAGEISTPYMSLPVPTVGVTTGPQWATDLNLCMSLIDSHNHSSGQGVPISPDGMNISSDLTFNNNNLISARSLQMFSQSSPLGLATDRTCLYSVVADLYFNDGAGNQVRITQGGAVVGPPGTITGLVLPASAAYVAANQTFVWQSNINTSAKMDCSSVLIRNLLAGSNAVTLQAPNPVPSNYSLTLPTIPGSKKIMTLDATGGMGGDYDVDNVGLEIFASQIRLKRPGIYGFNIVTHQVSQDNLYLRAFNTTPSGTQGAVVGSAASGWNPGIVVNIETLITNMSVQMTTSGRPVVIRLLPGSPPNINVSNIFGGSFLSASSSGFLVKCYRDSTLLGQTVITSGQFVQMLTFTDNNFAGAPITVYEIRVDKIPGTVSPTVLWDDMRMFVHDIN